MARLARLLWHLPWPAAMRRAGVMSLRLRPLGRMLLPHFTVGVVGLIQTPEGRILLLRHTYRGRTPWGLPSGFVEHGEQPSDALAREVEEETGIRVDVLPVHLVYTDRHHPTINIVFRGTVRDGEFRRSSEVAEIGYFALDDLPPLPRVQRQILGMLEHERGELSSV